MIKERLQVAATWFGTIGRKYAAALRAALADPAPDELPLSPDHPAWDTIRRGNKERSRDIVKQSLTDLRQSLDPRIAAVLDTLGEDMGVSDADGDGTRLCEICRERPGVGVVSDAGISWFMCRECAASDWTAAPRGDEAWLDEWDGA